MANKGKSSGLSRRTNIVSTLNSHKSEHLLQTKIKQLDLDLIERLIDRGQLLINAHLLKVSDLYFSPEVKEHIQTYVEVADLMNYVVAINPDLFQDLMPNNIPLLEVVSAGARRLLRILEDYISNNPKGFLNRWYYPYEEKIIEYISTYKPGKFFMKYTDTSSIYVLNCIIPTDTTIDITVSAEKVFQFFTSYAPNFKVCLSEVPILLPYITSPPRNGVGSLKLYFESTVIEIVLTGDNLGAVADLVAQDSKINIIEDYNANSKVNVPTLTDVFYSCAVYTTQFSDSPTVPAQYSYCPSYCEGHTLLPKIPQLGEMPDIICSPPHILGTIDLYLDKECQEQKPGLKDLVGKVVCKFLVTSIRTASFEKLLQLPIEDRVQIYDYSLPPKMDLSFVHLNCSNKEVGENLVIEYKERCHIAPLESARGINPLVTYSFEENVPRTLQDLKRVLDEKLGADKYVVRTLRLNRGLCSSGMEYTIGPSVLKNIMEMLNSHTIRSLTIYPTA